MKKLLLIGLCLGLLGCASHKDEVIIKTAKISEDDVISRQDKYEFDSCVALSDGDISRCENFEIVCYIAHNNYNLTNSISCFKK